MTAEKASKCDVIGIDGGQKFMCFSFYERETLTKTILANLRRVRFWLGCCGSNEVGSACD